ncbi:aminoacyl--tRNA ligase-related protein [Spirillospora sp. NPDC050679]
MQRRDYPRSIPGILPDAARIPTGAPGVMLGTAAAAELAASLAAEAAGLFGPCAHRLTAPPVMDAALADRTGYSRSFPHLLGRVGAGDRLVLAPAVCHHVYPLLEGLRPEEPLQVAVSGTCFRDEGTTETGRLRSFQMLEVLRVGPPEDCAAWRDEAVGTAARWLAGLGVETTAVPASDPFFGRTGRLLAAAQREQELKWELHARTGADTVQAVFSANCHLDHFSAEFGFAMADGPAHSACLGFGLDRLLLALSQPR